MAAGAVAVGAEEEVEEVLDVAGGDALQLTDAKGREKAQAVELRCGVRLSVERVGTSGRATVRVRGPRPGCTKAVAMLRAFCAFQEAATAEERGFCPWFTAGFCRFGGDCGPEGCLDGLHDPAGALDAQAAWLVQAPADGSPSEPAETCGRPLLLVLGCAGPGERAGTGEGEDEIVELAVLAICPRSRREVGRFHRFVRPSAWDAEEALEEETLQELEVTEDAAEADAKEEAPTVLAECNEAVVDANVPEDASQVPETLPDGSAEDVMQAEQATSAADEGLVDCIMQTEQGPEAVGEGSAEEMLQGEQAAEEAAGEGSAEDVMQAEEEVQQEEQHEQEGDAEAADVARVEMKAEVVAEDVPAEQLEESAQRGGEPLAQSAVTPPAAEAGPRAAGLRERFAAACFSEASPALPFTEALADLLDWLPGLLSASLDDMRPEDLLLVTVRDWDVQTVLPRQCDLPTPGAVNPALQAFLLCRWACLRDVFRAHYSLLSEAAPTTLRAIQRHLGLPFSDEQASRNSPCMKRVAGVGRVVQELLKGGWQPQPTAWREQVRSPTRYLLRCTDEAAQGFGAGARWPLPPAKRRFEDISECSSGTVALPPPPPPPPIHLLRPRVTWLQQVDVPPPVFPPTPPLASNASLWRQARLRPPSFPPQPPEPVFAQAARKGKVWRRRSSPKGSGRPWPWPHSSAGAWAAV